MKIVSVVGARPQFIKMGVLSRALRQSCQEVLVHTGQHYDSDMSDIFFERLGLPRPDHHLGVGSGPHGQQTGEMLIRIEEVLLRERPDMVVVFGDTNSTLAGALAAAKLEIPVAHVEAGLRSYAVMPEEVNRRVTDHISALLFTPCENADRNLKQESVPGEIHRVGDLLVEAVEAVLQEGSGASVLSDLDLQAGGFWLVTLHRADLTDSVSNLETVLRRLEVLDGTVIFPMHPRTRAAIDAAGLWSAVPSGVRVVKPVGFAEMLNLQKNARGIVTDSGGLQREAYLLGTPCVTAREETEWPETLTGGWNRIVGRDAGGLEEAVRDVRPAGERPSVFGDGKTSGRVTEIIASWLDRHSSARSVACGVPPTTH